MTNHSYKGLTQPLQTDMAKPCPAKHRPPPLRLLLLLLLSVTQLLLLEQRQVVYQCNCCPAAARTKTISISVQSFV